MDMCNILKQNMCLFTASDSLTWMETCFLWHNWKPTDLLCYKSQYILPVIMQLSLDGLVCYMQRMCGMHITQVNTYGVILKVKINFSPVKYM